MIITRKQLSEIEETVGHSCEVGVLAGPHPGSIVVRIWFEQSDRQMYSYEWVFCPQSQAAEGPWASELEDLKHRAKRDFGGAIDAYTYFMPDGLRDELAGDFTGCRSHQEVHG